METTRILSELTDLIFNGENEISNSKEITSKLDQFEIELSRLDGDFKTVDEIRAGDFKTVDEIRAEYGLESLVKAIIRNLEVHSSLRRGRMLRVKAELEAL